MTYKVEQLGGLQAHSLVVSSMEGMRIPHRWTTCRLAVARHARFAPRTGLMSCIPWEMSQ